MYSKITYIHQFVPIPVEQLLLRHSRNCLEEICSSFSFKIISNFLRIHLSHFRRKIGVTREWLSYTWIQIRISNFFYVVKSSNRKNSVHFWKVFYLCRVLILSHLTLLENTSLPFQKGTFMISNYDVRLYKSSKTHVEFNPFLSCKYL